jgi:hypothetical protein
VNGRQFALFMGHVEKSDDCWLWTGTTDRNGYGAVRDGKRMVLVHRHMFAHVHGEIASGLEIDHSCHNRSCVNPEHLRAVTHKQNMENLAGALSTNKSGIRGVYWRPDKQKWIVQVGHNKKKHHGGLFDTAKEAELAAVALRIRLYTHNEADRREAA